MAKWLRRILIVLSVVIVLVVVGPFLIPVPELEGLWPPQELAGEESLFTSIPFPGTEGIDIHYRQANDGGPDIVLLHGFNSNLYTWDKVFDEIAAIGSTTAYDRPPFGLSERLLPGDWDPDGPNPYTTAAAVEQLMALMTGQGIEQAVLVGNSAGGLIALQAAQTYPERVLGLVLADAAVYNSGAPTFLVPIANTPQMKRLGRLVSRAFAGNDSLLDMAYYDPSTVTVESKEKATIGSRVENWDEAFWQFTAAATSAQGVIDMIPATTVPALVISGQDDQIVPVEDSIRLAAELANAELVVIPDCGHVPQDECPDQFTRAVSEWFASQPFSDMIPAADS